MTVNCFVCGFGDTVVGSSDMTHGNGGGRRWKHSPCKDSRAGRDWPPQSSSLDRAAWCKHRGKTRRRKESHLGGIEGHVNVVRELAVAAREITDGAPKSTLSPRWIRDWMVHHPYAKSIWHSSWWSHFEQSEPPDLGNSFEIQKFCPVLNLRNSAPKLLRRPVQNK